MNNKIGSNIVTSVRMKKVPAIIIFTTVYAVFFNVAIYTGMSDDLIFTMFFLSPFLVIYMVYTILKYGKPSRHTFDEKFYDDWNYRRNVKGD